MILISISIVIITLLFLLIILFLTSSTYYEKYKPFADLKEIQLNSQNNTFYINIIEKLLGNKNIEEIDQPMIQGKYMRYDSLNSKLTRNSIVAVSAGYDNPNLLAWQAEIDIYNLNFVWCDVANHYWACPVIVSVNPVIVIKGSFPKCRYFSYYSYTGIELTDTGELKFGQGITEDSNNICNPTIPNNCKGLIDKDIEPDDGSKNPFNDPTYTDGDDTFYTIYFVSPYYTGKLPDSKNIIPLTVYGFDTAIILYRIYAPFNPKSCKGSIYSSLSSFNTQGCPPERQCDKIDVNHIKIIGNDGGMAYPELEIKSPCSNGDRVCINDCIQYNIGNAIANNKMPECIPFVGDNISCLCKEENKTGKCAAFVNDIVNKCSNNKATLSNLCANLPELTINGCVSDYHKNSSACSSVNIFTNCDEDDNNCKICKYSIKTDAQSCVIEHLTKNKNPDCSAFKNPVNTYKICDTDNTCVEDFKNILTSCYEVDSKYGDVMFKSFCDNKPNESKCTSYKDFTRYPISCDSSNTTCTKYKCENGFCIQSNEGKYDSPDCNGQCKQISSDKYSCINDSCIRSENGIYKTFDDCIKNCNNIKTIEGFDNLLYSSSSSSIIEKTCINRTDPKRCNPLKQRWKNIESNYVNTTNPVLLFSTGWVGLPNVFVKYSYNNYFIRLNNQDVINTKINLVKDINQLNQYINTNNSINPMDILSVTEENLLSPDDYEKNILKENYKEDETFNCSDCVDPDNYLYNGAVFSYGLLNNKNKIIKSPGCNYYTDLCICENRRNSKSGSCGLYTSGRLDCEGKPCFQKWSINEKIFKGEAEPFLISANVGKVIIFPNPDSQYIALNTLYDERYVYVIWLDIPICPNTPDYSNILKNNSYQMRYFSIGHYYWQMDLANPRPVLSAIQDNEMITSPIIYRDLKTNKSLESKRVCIVLATYDQYDYLKMYGLWDDRINWLNWGKTENPSFLSKIDKIKKSEQLQDVFINIISKFLENTIDIAEFIELLEISLNDNNNLNTMNSITELITILKKNLHTPEYGIVLCRQLLANPSFKESIQNYTLNPSNTCINESIKIENPLKPPIYRPEYISKSCNPGNPKLCDSLKLDPCCLAMDLLNHMKQYYPRCERVKICDIEKIGSSFWNDYIFLPLPYDVKTD